MLFGISLELKIINKKLNTKYISLSLGTNAPLYFLNYNKLNICLLKKFEMITKLIFLV